MAVQNGYPRKNVTYSTFTECRADNPHPAIIYRQDMDGTWWAVAKFPTMIDKTRAQKKNAYKSLYHVWAINGFDPNLCVECDARGVYHVVDAENHNPMNAAYDKMQPWIANTKQR